MIAAVTPGSLNAAVESLALLTDPRPHLGTETALLQTAGQVLGEQLVLPLVAQKLRNLRDRTSAGALETSD